MLYVSCGILSFQLSLQLYYIRYNYNELDTEGLAVVSPTMNSISNSFQFSYHVLSCMYLNVFGIKKSIATKTSKHNLPPRQARKMRLSFIISHGFFRVVSDQDKFLTIFEFMIDPTMAMARYGHQFDWRMVVKCSHWSSWVPECPCHTMVSKSYPWSNLGLCRLLSFRGMMLREGYLMVSN